MKNSPDLLDRGWDIRHDHRIQICAEIDHRLVCIRILCYPAAMCAWSAAPHLLPYKSRDIEHAQQVVVVLCNREITVLTAEIAENAEHFLSACSAVKFPALIHAVLCQDVDHIVLSKYVISISGSIMDHWMYSSRLLTPSSSLDSTAT